MKRIQYLGWFVGISIFLVACGKVTYRKTVGGMPYKLYKGDEKKKIQAGNYVKYHVKFVMKRADKDTVYFDSYNRIPVYAPVMSASQPYDVSEIWTQLGTGDSLVTTQMIDTFLKRNPDMGIDGKFKKGEKLITYIKILDVITTDSLKLVDEEMERKKYLAGEIAEVEAYLAKKNIKAVKTPSGAYVEIKKQGAGPIDSGKFVQVNYTGTSFSGKKFDSNTDSSFHHLEPLAFTVGNGSMIKGFDEAVMMMGVGANARVYVPSMLGYGPNPDPRSGIKPFEHIYFDIDVLGLQDQDPRVRPSVGKKIDQTQPQK